MPRGWLRGHQSTAQDRQHRAEVTDTPAAWEVGWGESLLEHGATNINVSFDDATRVYRLIVHLNGRLSPGGAITRLVASGAEVKNFALKTPSLEDVFIHLTGKSLRE